MWRANFLMVVLVIAGCSNGLEERVSSLEAHRKHQDGYLSAEKYRELETRVERLHALLLSSQQDRSLSKSVEQLDRQLKRVEAGVGFDAHRVKKHMQETDDGLRVMEAASFNRHAQLVARVREMEAMLEVLKSTKSVLKEEAAMQPPIEYEGP
jgi:hypothetical protein